MIDAILSFIFAADQAFADEPAFRDLALIGLAIAAVLMLVGLVAGVVWVANITRDLAQVCR